MIYGDDRLPERFWEKVYPEPNTGCWLWGGSLTNAGYGQIQFKRKGKQKVRTTHRVALEAAQGYLTEGLCVDHLCRQRSCCNPDHLEEVTSGENTRRAPKESFGHKAKEAHCKNGHEYTEENTRWTPDNWRACRACAREYAKAAYKRPVTQKWLADNEERLKAYRAQRYAYSTYEDNIKEDTE